jgi:hypothetical protein
LRQSELILWEKKPEGHIELANLADSQIRRLAATDLTFHNLLEPLLERPLEQVTTSGAKLKKAKTLFGAITTAKHLRQLIHAAERAHVLSSTESMEILQNQKMDMRQLQILWKFQRRRKLLRGRAASASRKAKGDRNAFFHSLQIEIQISLK